jgi:heterodisulfide reductase subunit B
LKIGYYPGCSNHGTSREFEMSARVVLKDLGVELEEVPDWVCCAASPGHHHSKLLSVSLGAYNLAQAKPLGLPVLVTCAACYSRLSAANYELEHDQELAAKVAETVEEPYDGSVEVKHIVDFLADDVGLEEIASKVHRRLEGLKVACYYGCLLTRPPDYAVVDDTEEPRKMERILESVGAEPVDWSHRTECCGAAFPFSRVDIVENLAAKILVAAEKAEADCIVVACPMCHANLDMRQSGAGRIAGRKLRIPIVYLTELIGLAYGHKPRELGLHMHLVPTRSVSARFA